MNKYIKTLDELRAMPGVGSITEGRSLLGHGEWVVSVAEGFTWGAGRERTFTTDRLDYLELAVADIKPDLPWVVANVVAYIEDEQDIVDMDDAGHLIDRILADLKAVDR